jgi:fibronectin-binding autotransporter adhesin
MTGFNGTLQLQAGGGTSNNHDQFNLGDGTAGAIGAGSTSIELIETGTGVSGNVGTVTLEYNPTSGAANAVVPIGDLNTGTITNPGSTGGLILSNGQAHLTTYQVGSLGLSDTFGGTIVNGSGSVSIDKVGAGVWTLTNSNTYTGGTTVDAGTLRAGLSTVVGTAGAFGNGTGTMTVNSSGALDLNGYNVQVGTLNGGGGVITNNNAVANRPSVLTVNGTTAATTAFPGTIQNGSTNTIGVTLASTNIGTLDLTGTSTFTGNAVVGGGALQVGGGAGSLGGASGVSLVLGAGGATSAALAVGDSTGIGTATISSIATSGSGAYSIVGGNASANSTINLYNNNTLAAQSYGGAIGSSGTGNNLNLVKLGSGQWNLTGTSTYTGTTAINNGGLGLLGGNFGNTAVTVGTGSSVAYLTATGNGSSTGTIAGAVTVSADAAIDFSRDGATSTPQTLTVGSLTLTTAASPMAATASSLTFNLTSTGADTITSTGVLTVGSGGQTIVNISGSATSGDYVLATYASQSGQTATGTAGMGATFGVGGSLGTGATINAGAFVLGSVPSGLVTLQLDDTATQLLLQVSATAAPATAYWSGAYATTPGGNNNWSGASTSPVVTNWSDSTGTVDSGQVPGSTTDVVFSAANSGNGANGTSGASLLGQTITANLAQAFTINSLTVNTTPAAVNITGSGVLTLEAAASASGGQGYPAGTGINVLSGAGPLTISTSGGVVPAANQTWTNASNSALTVSSNVSGNASLGNTTTLALSSTGSGSTLLSGVIADGSGGGNLALNVNSSGSGVTQLGNAGNTFTGGVTITAGTLQPTVSSSGSTGPLGPVSGTVSMAGGVLDLNGTSQTIGNLNGSSGSVLDNSASASTLTIGGGNATGGNYSGLLADNNNAGSGVLNLAKTGTGISILSGSSTFTGTTTVSAGALNIQSTNALVDSSGVSVSSGAALQIQGGNSPILNTVTINGTGVSANPNGAIESVSGGNSFGNAVVLGSASSIGVDAGSFTVTGPISGGVGLTLTGPGGVGTLASTLTTSVASLTKSGANTWVITGSNTYTGGTTLSAGTLQAGIATAGTTSGAFGGQNASLTISGGTLDLNGFNVGAGTMSTTNGVITDSSATPATLTVGNNNSSMNLTGLTAISGPLTIVVSGTGTWNTGANHGPTFSGAGLTSAGGLTFSNSTNASATYMNSLATDLGTLGVLTFNDGGITTGLTGAPAVTLPATNSIVVDGSGNNWGFQSNVTTNGPWTGSGSIGFSQGFTPTFTFAGNMSAFAGTLEFVVGGTTGNNAATYALTDSTVGIVGAGSAVVGMQGGAGNAGTLTLEWNGAGSQTIPLGDLNTTGNTNAVTNIRVLNNVASTVATWQVGALGLTSTYTGTIIDGTGISGLNKVGTGAWTLSGSSSYSGGTTVSDGTLTGSVAGALGSGFVTVKPTAATSTATDNAMVNTTNSIASAAAVTVNSETSDGGFGIGQINFNGTAPVIGSLTGNGNVVLNNAGGTALTTGNGSSTTFSGVISDLGAGNGSVTVAGSGTFTLTNSSTYGGSTTVNSGATLALGNGTTDGSIAGTSGVTDNGSLVYDVTQATRSAGYPISGTGNVSVSGTQTVALGGTSTYSGSTYVSGGTLDVTGTVANSGTITVDATNTPAALILDGTNAISPTAPITGIAGVTNLPVITVNSSQTIASVLSAGTTNFNNGVISVGNIDDTSVGYTSTLNVATGANVTTTLNNSGTLDLKNNDLIDTSGQLATIQSLITTAYGTGTWNGTGGLTSSSAAANPASYGLGYEAGAAYTSGSHLTTFDGQTVTSGETLVKYTLLGDVYLTGNVGLTDYNAVLANYNTGTTWAQGAFHPGSNTGLSDYNAVLANYNKNATGSLVRGSLVGAITHSITPSLAPAVNPSGADMTLDVNTITGDVSLVANRAFSFSGYNILDGSAKLQDSHDGAAGNPNNEYLLSAPLGQTHPNNGNTTTFRNSSNYQQWAVVADNKTSISEAQNNSTYNSTASSTWDDISLPAGGSIDFGNVYDKVGNAQKLSFSFSEGDPTNNNNPVTGNYTFNGTVDYLPGGSPTPEPGTLGIIGLAGVMMMRRRRRNGLAERV